MFGYAAPSDTNLDWSVDILDVAKLFATGLYDTGPYNTPTGAIVAVPEPSMPGIVGLGAGIAGLLTASRKRAA